MSHWEGLPETAAPFLHRGLNAREPGGRSVSLVQAMQICFCPSTGYEKIRKTALVNCKNNSIKYRTVIDRSLPRNIMGVNAAVLYMPILSCPGMC